MASATFKVYTAMASSNAKETMGIIALALFHRNKIERTRAPAIFENFSEGTRIHKSPPLVTFARALTMAASTTTASG